MSATETSPTQAKTGNRNVILKLADVHTYYGTIQALKGITLEVLDGEIVTLIGANGAGKSTTLRSINGLNHPREGTIEFQGTDITNRPPHDIVPAFCFSRSFRRGNKSNTRSRSSPMPVSRRR